MSGAVTQSGPGWRADVRDRVAAALKAGVPQVKGRVHRARTWPLMNDENSRPALLVYGYDEKKTLVSADMMQRHFSVSGRMMIAVRHAGRVGARADGAKQEAELEAILQACERAVLTSPDVADATEGVTDVTTVMEVLARGDDVEAESQIVFEMKWSEIFHVAEEEPCADAAIDLRPSGPGFEQ